MLKVATEKVRPTEAPAPTVFIHKNVDEKLSCGLDNGIDFSTCSGLIQMPLLYIDNVCAPKL